MNLRIICRTTGVVLLLSLSCTALAQYEETDKSRLGIGFSFVCPSGSQLRNIENIWIGPVLDFHFAYDKLDRPSGVASIGWFGQEAELYKASFVPIKVSYIKRFGEDPKSGFYVGAGLDAYFVTYRGIEYDPITRDNILVNEKGTPIGVSLLSGFEFGGAWYGEVRYDTVKSLSLPTGNSANFSGLSITFGSRFAF